MPCALPQTTALLVRILQLHRELPAFFKSSRTLQLQSLSNDFFSLQSNLSKPDDAHLIQPPIDQATPILIRRSSYY